MFRRYCIHRIYFRFLGIDESRVEKAVVNSTTPIIPIFPIPFFNINDDDEDDDDDDDDNNDGDGNDGDDEDDSENDDSDNDDDDSDSGPPGTPPPSYQSLTPTAPPAESDSDGADSTIQTISIYSDSDDTTILISSDTETDTNHDKDYSSTDPSLFTPFGLDNTAALTSDSVYLKGLSTVSNSMTSVIRDVSSDPVTTRAVTDMPSELAGNRSENNMYVSLNTTLYINI